MCQTSSTIRVRIVHGNKHFLQFLRLHAVVLYRGAYYTRKIAVFILLSFCINFACASVGCSFICNCKRNSQVTSTAIVSSGNVPQANTPLVVNRTSAEASGISVGDNTGSDSGVSSGGSEGSPAVAGSRISHLATLPRERPSDSQNRMSIVTIGTEKDTRSNPTLNTSNSTFKLGNATVNQTGEKFYTAPSNRQRSYPTLNVRYKILQSARCYLQIMSPMQMFVFDLF